MSKKKKNPTTVSRQLYEDLFKKKNELEKEKETIQDKLNRADATVARLMGEYEKLHEDYQLLQRLELEG